MGVVVQLSKSYQLEPEIRDDLQGRIEVFDQSIRSFEKRLRAVERRLSLEAPQTLQAGKFFSGMSPDSFQEENSINLAAGSSVSPQGPSVSPEASFPLRITSYNVCYTKLLRLTLAAVQDHIRKEVLMCDYII